MQLAYPTYSLQTLNRSPKKSMRLLFLISILLFPIPGFSQLPDVSKDLVNKLNEWEVEKTAQLQKEIEEKRRQVVALLQKQLAETTKSGNLEGALAIKKEIERLKPQSKPQKTVNQVEPPSRLSPIIDGNINLDWLTTVQFRKANGRVYWYENGIFYNQMEGNAHSQKMPIVKIEGEEVVFKVSGNVQRLKFQRRGREVLFYASQDDESGEELVTQERPKANKSQ